MTTAIESTANFIRLMDRAADGAMSGRDASACENRADAARWVLAFLTGRPHYDMPVSKDNAIKGAARAWRKNIPPEVNAALND